MEDATFPSAPFLTDDRNLWPSPMSNDSTPKQWLATYYDPDKHDTVDIFFHSLQFIESEQKTVEGNYVLVELIQLCRKNGERLPITTGSMLV